MPRSMAKYYPEVKAGKVFIGSTAVAGTAFPISTGTAVTFGLWNTSTNKDAVLMSLSVGYTSGTIALGEIGIANQNCGYAVAAGGPLTAFNAGTPKNAYLGSGNASAMSFTPAATTTLASGGTACWWSGYSIESATAGLGIFRAQIDIDGQVVVPPGQLVFVCGSVAQTALFTMSLVWAEVDA
jgi:hypothetical protein